MTQYVPRWSVSLLITLITLWALSAVSVAQPVILRVDTDQPYDSVYTPAPVSIIFNMDANGAEVASVTCPFFFTFSNGNIIGPVHEDTAFTGSPVFIYSDKAKSVFENLPFNAAMGSDFYEAPVDSLLWGFLDFDGHGWTGSGELCRLVFLPTDTGSFDIVDGFLAPASGLYVLDKTANIIPLNWIRPTIHIPAQPGAVRFRVASSYGTDSLFVGGKGTLYFTVDAKGNNIAALSFPLQFVFSGGNIIGPVSEGDAFNFSTYAGIVFEHLAFNDIFGADVTNPDTLLWGALDYNGQGWTSYGSMATITFTPTDTGTFSIDTIPIPPVSGMYPINQNAESLPFDWVGKTFTVAPCPVSMGDVNDDGAINSSDIIYLVNTVFRAGPLPLPRPESGDVACKGRLDAAGVLYLVRYIFKGGDPPCTCFVKSI